MNLRERLAAISGPVKKKPEEQAPVTCLEVSHTHPFEEFPGWQDVGR